MKPEEPKQRAAELVSVQVHLPLGLLSYHKHSDTIYNPELQPRESEHRCAVKQKLALG